VTALKDKPTGRPQAVWGGTGGFWLPGRVAKGMAGLFIVLWAGGLLAAPPAGSALPPGHFPRKSPAQGKPSPAPVILVLGDSLSAGLGVPSDKTYPALLQARLIREGAPHRVVNAGVSGDTSAGGAARLDWLLTQKPSILILALGGNDGLRGLPPAETRKNLSDIILRSQAAGAKVLLAGVILPVNFGQDYRDAFNVIFPDLAARYHLSLIPFLLEGVAGRRELNQPDGLHPNPQGYEIVAETVWNKLKPML